MPGSDILCSLPPAKPAVGTEEPAAAWTHSKPSWREMLVVSWPAWLLYNGWVDGNGMLRCAIGGKTEEVQRRGLDIKSVSRDRWRPGQRLGAAVSHENSWLGDVRPPSNAFSPATLCGSQSRRWRRCNIGRPWFGVGESSFVLGIVVCVQRF
jgi:hypothetical protein